MEEANDGGYLSCDGSAENFAVFGSSACDVPRINKWFMLKVRSRDLTSSTSAASLLNVLPQLTLQK